MEIVINTLNLSTEFILQVKIQEHGTNTNIWATSNKFRHCNFLLMENVN
jgi:hypothetical protein